MFGRLYNVGSSMLGHQAYTYHNHCSWYGMPYHTNLASLH